MTESTTKLNKIDYKANISKLADIVLISVQSDIEENSMNMNSILNEESSLERLVEVYNAA